MTKRDIRGLTLITSAVCNLNCSFCFLNKNESYKEFNLKVQEAWADGSYLENVANTLYKIGNGCDDITSICLWGGEPFLYIDNIIPALPQFFKYFRNLDEIWTSTNFSIDVDRMVKFLIALDENANKKFGFKLQMSIDGPEGIFTEEGHNVKWDIYKKNFDKLTDSLNNIKFKNIKVFLSTKSTVAEKTYLKYFSNMENMKNYYLKMLELKKYVNDRITNRDNIEWNFPIQFPTPSTPSEATVEDGITYGEIARLWNYLKIKDKDIVESSRAHPYFGFGRYLDPINYMSANAECSELRNRLTIWPDGTIVECGSCFILPYEGYKEYLKTHNEVQALDIAETSSKVAYNPLEMTDEEIEKQEWFSVSGFKNNYSTQYHLVMALCDEMAQSGQINYKYHLYPELLLQHITMMTEVSACTRDNLKTSQIPYVSAPSQYRKFLNGAVDAVLGNNDEIVRKTD